jgi:soluble lytic murein transglycosylase
LGKLTFPLPKTPVPTRSVRPLVLALLFAIPALAWGREVGPPDLRAAVDSARAELEVGRAWHATRILRGARAHEGSPETVLLLARAESGWKNHDAVRTLLEGAGWLDEIGGGAGWALLAEARAAGERWGEAATAWASYLASPMGAADGRRASLQIRRARALARGGMLDGALEILGTLGPEAADLRSWLALELAEEEAETGDTAAVRALAARITERGARARGWRIVADARLAAADTTGAVTALREALAGPVSGARRAAAEVELGLLVLARGDTAGAVALLRDARDDAPRASAGRAARALLEATDPDRSTSLELAALMDRAGDGAGALRAYERAWRLAEDGRRELTGWQRLSRARLLSTVPSRRDEALAEFRALHEEVDDPRLGARNLEIWSTMRRRQGLDAHVATLQRWLLERYPSSDQAAEIFWDRGWGAESRGALDEALGHYAAVADNARTHARAGRARMRSGQIHLSRGNVEEAARVFEQYLEDFPDGRRWEEASYWAAWSRARLGDEAAARAHVARIRRGAPFSYYAVVGGELLEEPFVLDLPEGPAAAEPAWLLDGLERLDALVAARLPEGAEALEDSLVERAEGSAPVTLRLAEALIERGRTIAGINLGWSLVADGHPWDHRLVRVVYPFPYREMVRREAAEWGVDPIMLAALIRQESAFEAEIVSHAGAIGLMQVMPPTGRALARSHGPDGFQPESLTTPEVNLHLGAAFFAEMSRRYDGELPLILSAYNAGPTRATRWRRYPEAADWLRFTERIPFDETRGYVKNVRRNLGVYQLLYASE